MGLHEDLDGDHIADRGRVIPPELLDRQSELFRGHDMAVPDELLGEHADVVYPPLGMSTEPIRLPEDYEAEQWDAGREGPKSADEARAALAVRIADPLAPDGPEVEGAYDELGDPNPTSSTGGQ